MHIILSIFLRILPARDLSYYNLETFEYKIVGLIKFVNYFVLLYL